MSNFIENLTETEKSFIQELLNRGKSFRYTAKCFVVNFPETGLKEETVRKELSKHKDLFDKDVSTQTTTETNQYENGQAKMPSAWSAEKGRFLDIDEYCEKYGLPRHLVSSSKLITHNVANICYNIAFRTSFENVDSISEEFIENLVKNHVHPRPRVKIVEPDNSWIDRLVISDIHIGMDTSGPRNVEPLYETPWNGKILFERGKKIIEEIVSNKKGSTLYIDDLGDYLDGYEGQTTRKGHDLPQNMSDKESFETGVEFKMFLIENLLKYYKKIVFNNIVEDNHSGTFSYFVNSTVKKIVEAAYPEIVEFNIRNKFIEHYSVGLHTFIICHGKDSSILKFGFKPQLDAVQIEKIDQYCKEYKLYRGNFIEFSKGDSHQCLFDYTTSNDFDYCNYPAFSPPSNWVKTNFKNSRSGFVFQNVDTLSSKKIIHPFFF